MELSPRPVDGAARIGAPTISPHRRHPRIVVVLQVQLAQLRLIQGQQGVLGWPVG
jgi:hypothetical protein